MSAKSGARRRSRSPGRRPSSRSPGHRSGSDSSPRSGRNETREASRLGPRMSSRRQSSSPKRTSPRRVEGSREYRASPLSRSSRHQASGQEEGKVELRLLEVTEDKGYTGHRPRKRNSSPPADKTASEATLPPPPPLPGLPPPPPLPLGVPPPPVWHDDPSLDFFSLTFDAAKALATPNLERPNMKVAALESVQQCRFILPEEMEESLANKKIAPHKSKEELEERRGRSGVARMRRFREEISGSAVERIAQSVNTGPLLLLRQCQFAGGRIKLVTRHSRGVRGTCSGVLKAFDRHMNLILQDVEENYTVRIKVERTKLVHSTRVVQPDALPGAAEAGNTEAAPLLEYSTEERTRTAFKQDHRSRKLKQIFVRGSNIVLISTIPP